MLIIYLLLVANITYVFRWLLSIGYDTREVNGASDLHKDAWRSQNYGGGL